MFSSTEISPLLASLSLANESDVFCRFEKLLIMSSILAFQMSLTLKTAYFSVLP